MGTRVNGVDLSDGAALSDATPAALGVAAAGVSTDASRADHVHALPTIPAVSSATPQPLGVAAAGSTGEASDAGHVHAAPTQAYTDTPLSTASSSGWTLRDGDGTAAITGGVARLTLGLGVVPGPWSDVPAAAQAHGRDAHNVDVRVRVAAVTGGNSSAVFMAFGLRRGTAGSDGIFWNLRGDGGDSTVYREGLSGSGSIASASINRAAIAAGTLWLRLAIRGGMLLAAHGTGVSTAEPTDWTVVYSTAAIMSPASYISQVVCSLDAIAGGSPDAVTVDLAGFRVQGGAP